jgi:hypothetical protein
VVLIVVCGHLWSTFVEFLSICVHALQIVAGSGVQDDVLCYGSCKLSRPHDLLDIKELEFPAL